MLIPIAVLIILQLSVRGEDACGGVIRTTNGTITSPAFPKNYPPSTVCVWGIYAPPQHRIFLIFTHIDLEGTSPDCENDMVEIWSTMAHDEKRKYGTFCGSKLPALITSENNSLWLGFGSDYSLQKSGFSAFFFIDKDECETNNGGCQHICNNTIGSYICSCHDDFVLQENLHDCKKVCGGRLLADDKVKHIYSHAKYGDENYESMANCDWIVKGLNDQKVRLQFLTFDTEHDQDCAYDYVEVFDGDDTSAKSFGRFCGNKVPAEFHSSGDSLMVHFETDYTISKMGFSAAYSVMDSSMESNDIM